MIGGAVGGLDRMELFVTKLTCVLLLLAENCRGNRVHFRIHTSDLVNQHTHTRTVYLKPSKHGWTDKGVTLRLGSFHQDQQHPPQPPPPPRTKHEYFHSTKHPVSTVSSLPLVVLPAAHSHRPLPVYPVYPAFALPQQGLPVSSESLGDAPPTPTPPLAEQPASTRPHRPHPAALKAPDLKSGCRMFVDAHGVEVADGNCFLEEYEKGYNQEQSKKTFYGDGHYNEDTQQEGERNSNKYKNEHKYTQQARHPRPHPHPVIRHDWLHAPDGKYRLVQSKVQPKVQSGRLPPGPGSRGAVRQEGPLLVRLTSEVENTNLVGAGEGVRLVGPVKLFRVAAAAPDPRPVREEEEEGGGGPDVEVEHLVEDFRRQKQGRPGSPGSPSRRPPGMAALVSRDP